MRNSASSVDEILFRHGCVGRTESATSIPTREPYQTGALVANVTVAVGTSLADTFPIVRGSHEVDEVYVRPVGEMCFEPLRGDHLARMGSWVLVARQRHPVDDPRIIGVMLAKDEADVVGDVITKIRSALSRLYYYADPETREVVERAIGGSGWAAFVPMPKNDRVVDGHRQYLLEAARQDRGTDPRPTWIVNIQGDEVYADDLLQHIRLAQREQSTLMTAQVATFVLHESQRTGWDWMLPIERRLTHYVWDFGEHAAFVDFPWVYWTPGEHMRAHPHGVYPAKWATARPVRRHVPFRDPDQARKRVEDRIASGWQPHYENYRDVFMNETAAGKPIKRYHGWFPEAERVEGIW